ncbi:DNA primase [uncultured Psychrobacillus sp.]|uniref:DNA primase n=1 Tax=uncultured Psychrobacillus sp. TaxID=1551585 RepID=UPI002604133B|nr:DNA primase [uncultured Psychrobacillus sp.]
MNRIEEEVIEQVRNNTDIVDVISEFVQLTKRGRNFFGLCPFHGEQTPSFSVTQEKQIFHCFGCGAGGNVITFLMDIENLSFHEAVSKLGSRLGMQIEHKATEVSEEKAPVSKEVSLMKKAHEFASEYFHHLLLHTEEGENALHYLQERGFSTELIEKYKIGWSLPSWDALTTLLERKGMDLQEIEKTGLIIRKENELKYFDRFRGRIMFPVFDETGHVVAFSGRILGKKENEAKYLNSPESPIFQKSQILYNLDKARLDIRKKRNVVIFEGFLDVISASKAGITNGVATMGTALTSQHITKLNRLTSNVTLCFDGDKAGMEAAKRAAISLQGQNIQTEVAIIPDAMDPDDYIKNYGEEAFKEKIIEKPHSYLSFMMIVSKRDKNFNNENDTLQYIQEILEILSERNSSVERDLYIRQLSQETNVSEEAIYQHLRKIQGKKARDTKSSNHSNNSTPLGAPQELPKKKRTLSADERAERILLAHMLHNPQVIDIAIRTISDGPCFIRDAYEAAYVRLMGYYEDYPEGDYQRFLEVLNDGELRKIVMEAALSERDPEHETEEVMDCLRHIRKYRIEQQIGQKLHEAKEAEKMTDITKALQLAQEAIQLKKSLVNFQ